MVGNALLPARCCLPLFETATALLETAAVQLKPAVLAMADPCRCGGFDQIASCERVYRSHSKHICSTPADAARRLHPLGPAEAD